MAQNTCKIILLCDQYLIDQGMIKDEWLKSVKSHLTRMGANRKLDLEITIKKLKNAEDKQKAAKDYEPYVINKRADGICPFWIISAKLDREPLPDNRNILELGYMVSNQFYWDSIAICDKNNTVDFVRKTRSYDGTQAWNKIFEKIVQKSVMPSFTKPESTLEKKCDQHAVFSSNAVMPSFTKPESSLEEKCDQHAVFSSNAVIPSFTKPESSLEKNKKSLFSDSRTTTNVEQYPSKKAFMWSDVSMQILSGFAVVVGISFIAVSALLLSSPLMIGTSASIGMAMVLTGGIGFLSSSKADNSSDQSKELFAVKPS